MDSPDLRKAIESVQPQRVAFELRFSQSKPIFEAVMAIRNNLALYNALSPERKRVVDVTVKDFRTSGVGLEPAARARFNALVDKLSKLSTTFNNNVLDSTGVSGGGGEGGQRAADKSTSGSRRGLRALLGGALSPLTPPPHSPYTFLRRRSSTSQRTRSRLRAWSPPRSPWRPARPSTRATRARPPSRGPGC
jgi:hypothetical protein